MDNFLQKYLWFSSKASQFWYKSSWTYAGIYSKGPAVPDAPPMNISDFHYFSTTIQYLPNAQFFYH